MKERAKTPSAPPEPPLPSLESHAMSGREKVLWFVVSFLVFGLLVVGSIALWGGQR